MLISINFIVAIYETSYFAISCILLIRKCTYNQFLAQTVNLMQFFQLILRSVNTSGRFWNFTSCRRCEIQEKILFYILFQYNDASDSNKMDKFYNRTNCIYLAYNIQRKRSVLRSTKEQRGFVIKSRSNSFMYRAGNPSFGPCSQRKRFSNRETSPKGKDFFLSQQVKYLVRKGLVVIWKGTCKW